MLLAGVLVTLNLALWLAPAGLALRQAVIQQLFGPKLIRADVLDRNGVGTTIDWRLDRGVVTQLTTSQVTVREADGRVQPIALSLSTHFFRQGHKVASSALTTGWHVLVTWPANGAAVSVDLERPPQGQTAFRGRGAAPVPRLS
jgi:hypothetical protein